MFLSISLLVTYIFFVPCLEHRIISLQEIIRVLCTPVLIRTPFQLPTARSCCTGLLPIFELRRPNRRFTVDQLLRSACPRRLFDARWPYTFTVHALIWTHRLRA